VDEITEFIRREYLAQVDSHFATRND
jgi:hypothetical protein